MSVPTKCPQCGKPVPSERLTCKACGFEVFKASVAKADASAPSVGVALGCLGIVAIPALCLMALFGGSHNDVAALQPPDPAELARDAAEAKFQRGQEPLWRADPASITEDRLSGELAKCRQRINPPGAVEAYVGEIDWKKALAGIKSGYGVVELTGQRRVPTGKVAWLELRCRFKGIGFESFDSKIVGFTDEFLSAP